MVEQVAQGLLQPLPEKLHRGRVRFRALQHVAALTVKTGPIETYGL